MDADMESKEDKRKMPKIAKVNYRNFENEKLFQFVIYFREVFFTNIQIQNDLPRRRHGQ